MDLRSSTALTILFVFAALIGQCLTARILLLPGMMGSHVNFFAEAGQILKTDGHQVDSLVLKVSERLRSEWLVLG